MAMIHMLSKEKNDIIKNTNAETAITHMIFFIAAMIIAISVVAFVSADVQSMVASSGVSSKVLSEQMRTDITIINDPELIPYNDGIYSFYAKNTGKTELSPEFITVLVDGIMMEPQYVDTTLMDGDVTWRPGDVLVLNVTKEDALMPGDHRVLIAAENGKSASMSFKIRQ